MSLIHQALKKLDSSAGIPPKQRVGTTVSKNNGTRKKVLFTLMLVSILFFAVVAVIKYIPKTATEPGRGVENEPSAKRVKTEQPGIAEKEKSKNATDAITLYRAGKYDGSIKLFIAALKTRPDDPVLHNNLGLVYFEDGQIELARKQYTRALSLKHDYAEAINNYGALLAHAGKSKEAIKLYNKAIGIKPDFQPAYFNKAVEYEKNEKYAKARRWYKEYLRFSTVNERDAIKKRIKELGATE